MPSPRLPLEFYAQRVNDLAIALGIAWVGIETGRAICWVFAVLFLVAGVRAPDYPTATSWWFGILWKGTFSVVFLTQLLGPLRERPASFPRLGLVVAFAAFMAAGVMILVTGRLRKVWKFTRPAE